MKTSNTNKAFEVLIPAGFPPMYYNENRVPVNLEPHNLTFDHVKGHLLYLRVMRYPHKQILKFLQAAEDEEVKITRVLFRMCIRHNAPVAFALVVEFNTTTAGKRSGRKSYTVTENEIAFGFANDSNGIDKERFIKIVDPYIWHIEEANSEKTAAHFMENYNDWAHPLTLEKVIADLTEDQKKAAAKLIYNQFNKPAGAPAR